jgi:hypothetical protein
MKADHMRAGALLDYNAGITAQAPQAPSPAQQARLMRHQSQYPQWAIPARRPSVATKGRGLIIGFMQNFA